MNHQNFTGVGIYFVTYNSKYDEREKKHKSVFNLKIKTNMRNIVMSMVLAVIFHAEWQIL